MEKPYFGLSVLRKIVRNLAPEGERSLKPVRRSWSTEKVYNTRCGAISLPVLLREATSVTELTLSGAEQ